MALVGVLLLRARFATQLAAALLVIAAFVFAGVFFPLITEHLFSESLLVTTCLVGLVWLSAKAVLWFQAVRASRREMRVAPPQQNGIAAAGVAPIVGNEIDSTESPPANAGDPAPKSDDEEKEDHNE